MFKSGSITSVGSKSEEEGRESLNQTAFEISQKAESRYKVKNIKTVNIIALISIGQKINLEKILLKIQNVKYNRHVFAGAVVQLHENKLLVFNTGKIISVGCKSKEKAKASIYEMCNLLKQNKIII